MSYLVKPKTFLIGYTCLDINELLEYLKYSNNQDFYDNIRQAQSEGLSDGEILCSFYAKLCYKSLSLGKNSNITKVRDIQSNLMGVIDSGHGSVLESCNLNFITTDCSRIFTHELVRHRVGTHFSQTSGRYVKLDDPKIIFPPDFNDCEDIINEYMEAMKSCVKKLEQRKGLDNPIMPFGQKKKLTSAIRRIAPNGLSNEIGFSLNLRTLRHTIELRTSRHAEWEIRFIFNQIAEIIENKWPLMLYGGHKAMQDNMWEYTNLRV